MRRDDNEFRTCYKPYRQPVPRGLLGFGMTTILLNLHHAALIGLSAVVVAMGFALGGAALIIVGIMEYKKNNNLWATAFTAYGFFWWSLILIWMNPSGQIAPADAVSMGWYLLLWGVFTLLMFVATLKLNKGLQVVFFSLAILFFLLAAGDFTGNTTLTRIGGYVGIFCGTSAIYCSLAQVINEVYGTTKLPV